MLKAQNTLAERFWVLR